VRPQARTYIDDATTIVALLEQRAAADMGTPLCLYEDQVYTASEMRDAAHRLASGLAARGIGPGDRVAVMLPNHPDTITTMFALFLLRATWVPINIQLRGLSLRYILEHADPRAIIASVRYQDVLAPVFEDHGPSLLIWHGTEAGGGRREAEGGRQEAEVFADLAVSSAGPYVSGAEATDVLGILYTSGTTGSPKGVTVTDTMLRACATGVLMAGDIRPGDVLFVWEPLYHIGGSQVVIAALMEPVTLALVERFSVSRFWDQVRATRATHIHHLGGILQLLLKAPPSAADRQHTVRIAWGGGCTAETWTAFEHRFGVRIHEVYGMTEASSISTVNTVGKVGSVGKAVPCVDVQVIDEDGRPVAPGTLGEIVIGERKPGLLTPGYYRDPEQTARTLRDEWLFTGDLGRLDEEGFLSYAGRKTDSVRRRGENISAWEVERIVNAHPDVEQTALVGVASDIGEMDLKIFIKPVPGRDPDPAALIAWCESQMPRFQVPRYVAFVSAFEMTPTQRIRKESLSRATDDCWDRERPGKDRV
jgi:crotonobetaine/carnitine-CoA ligase